MRAQTPAESCHVLPAAALSGQDVRLFALREGGKIKAIGAIRIYDTWGELKSMHTDAAARGQGFGAAMLASLIGSAEEYGLQSLKLETGTGSEHVAARRLYASAGFTPCQPFGDYSPDPLSVFMARDI